MSVIMEKAHALANALKESEELDNLRMKEAAMANDPEAQKILAEYQKVRQEVDQKRAAGEELTEEEKELLAKVEQKMQENETISAYLEAQREFNSILQGVNFIITKALSGEDSNTCGPGCGGSCC
ncbi:MAG: YlbF family regulator [Thermoanaerobacteraceae bacterium]|nr:YlbF family regulator [Thermoanaerobacteraceae bacterium]